MQQNLDLLRSELQLAHEREKAAIQIAAEATQMVEIAQDRVAKATKRKFRPFFKWIDNPTYMHENEAANLVQQNLDLLRSELQLAHEREKAAI